MPQEKPLYKNKEWLEHQYWDEELSTLKIAKLLHCSPATIGRWLARLNIPRRALSDAVRVSWRQPRASPSMPHSMVCKHCGKQFEIQASETRQFCSTGCHRAWQREHRKRYPVTCQYCGITFHVIKSRLGRARFCSVSCQDKGHGLEMRGRNNFNWKPKVKKPCKQCGAVMTVHPCKIDTQNFCSKDCLHQWQSENMSGANSPLWNGGTQRHYYGPNWREQRRKARKRDRVCQRCGTTPKENGKALDVHHRIPFELFGYIPEENDNYLEANKLTNLICYCRRCHSIVESQINDLDFLPQFGQQLELPLEEVVQCAI